MISGFDGHLAAAALTPPVRGSEYARSRQGSVREHFQDDVQPFRPGFHSSRYPSQAWSRVSGPVLHEPPAPLTAGVR